MSEIVFVCEISGTHSSITEDSSLLGCDTVSLCEWFLAVCRALWSVRKH
jgi:hypothetical protein